MNTGSAGTIIRRVAVVLNASMQSSQALQAAAELAASLQAELEGIFIEDINLFHLAELPARFYDRGNSQCAANGTGTQVPGTAGAAEAGTDRTRERYQLFFQNSTWTDHGGTDGSCYRGRCVDTLQACPHVGNVQARSHRIYHKHCCLPHTTARPFCIGDFWHSTE